MTLVGPCFQHKRSSGIDVMGKECNSPSESTREGTNTNINTSARSSMLQRTNNDLFNDAQSQGINMPSDQHINMSHSTEDQMSALLHAISLVSKLAAMDSAAYHTDREIVTDALMDVQPTANANTKEVQIQIQTKKKIQAQLDNLQSKWKQEDTPIPSLIASTHRLQSNIGHLQQESTNLTTQFNNSSSDLKQTLQKNSKLKMACRKLYSHNRKLVEKLHKKKEENRHFIRTVRDFVTQKKQEELDTEELIVACHEAMLKHGGHGQGRGISVSVSDSSFMGDASNAGMGGNRSRANTAESNVSDSYCYLGDYSIFEGEEENSTDGNDDINNDNDNDDTSYRCVANPKITGTSDDNESLVLGGTEELDYDCSAIFDLNMSISSSSRSLVTDDAIATVRFADPFAASPLNKNHIGIHAGNDDVNINVKAKVNTKGGKDKFKKSISFDAIGQRSRASLNATPAPSQESSQISHLQAYTLSFPRSREIGLQFVDVPIPILGSGSSNSNSNLKTSSLAPSVGTRNRAFSDSSVLKHLSVVDECQESTPAKSNVQISPSRASKSMFASPDRSILKARAFSSPGSFSVKEKSKFTMDNVFGIQTLKKKQNESKFTMENFFGIQTPKKKQDDACARAYAESPCANGNSSTCERSQQNAILVKDFQGFDASLNIRPAVGARLIAINDLSLLEGKWALQKVKNFLEGQRLSISQSNNDIKLTFRNDVVGNHCQEKKMEEMVSERVTQCGTIADLDSPSPKATKKAAIFPTTTQRISEKKAKPFFHAAISGDKSSKGDDSVSFFGFTITK